jgi:maltooligosyltrehalose trehalohydrolase
MIHAMPFGAQCGADGVRFRLWAPAVDRVWLQLEDSGQTLPMTAEPGGWFALTTDHARHGTRYRYLLPDGTAVPDPASRFQPDDVHAPSAVWDARRYAWRNPQWRGRPWHEAVLYELHVGAFTPEGSFAGVAARLDHLAGLGVTALSLMPVADFAGRRNWGYDGVLPYAPDSSYGTPDDLRALVDAAHGRGLMVVLDVVYNHFGPDGNYLGVTAPGFFTDRIATPWGAAIDYARREVRDFAIHNALYWLDEFGFDGLRLDAVHAIHDESTPHLLDELASAVHARFDGQRRVHLILENEHNSARLLARDDQGRALLYTAQWNDDIHHALHCVATAERDAYYRDYADDPARQLARCLAEGFAYQGEWSRHLGAPRGEPSAHLPPAAFIAFAQNHDQVGNRAFGERLCHLADAAMLDAVAAIVLLAPAPPLLFMGEEWAAPEPFLFFCDFHDALADAVREGRRREFARFPAFADAASRERIPDPNAESTFLASRLDWPRLGAAPHAERLALHRRLLALRHAEITPRLAALAGGCGRYTLHGENAFSVAWRLGDGAALRLDANLGRAPQPASQPLPDGARLLFALGAAHGPLPPCGVRWHLVA